MTRIWNFSAGPAVLPAEVLEQVKDEMLDWHGAGCGVMEMSHRGKEFTGDHRDGRSRPARTARHPGQLPGALPAGRRDAAVRPVADEPAAGRRIGRLPGHRVLVQEGAQGSAARCCRRRLGAQCRID